MFSDHFKTEKESLIMKKFVLRSLLIMASLIGMMCLVGCPTDPGNPGETRAPVPPQYQGTFVYKNVFEVNVFEVEISDYQFIDPSPPPNVIDIWFVEPNLVYNKNGVKDELFLFFIDTNTVKNMLNDDVYTRKTQ
jgi:hypothetical protein